MRDLSTTLIQAGQSRQQEPLCKVEAVTHPFMLGTPIQFTEYADMSGTGPIDGVALDSGNIIIIHPTSGYKLITVPTDTSQWVESWTAYSPVLPDDTEAIAIAASGNNVQIFAQATVIDYDVFVLTSSDGGYTWGSSWTNIGTPEGISTEPVQMTWVGACALYNALFIKAYAIEAGVYIEAFVYESGWNQSHIKTALIDPVPENTRLGAVTKNDNSYVVFFSAINPATLDNNVSVFSVEFTPYMWGQPQPISFYMAQEYTRSDILKSISQFVDRKVMVIETERGRYMSTKDLFNTRYVFDNYSGHWRLISDFEDDEIWSGGSTDTANYVEGAQGRKITSTNAVASSSEYTLSESLDLDNEGRFGDYDYLCLACYVDDTANMDTVDIIFQTSVGNYYVYQISQPQIATGWNYFAFTKNTFSSVGSPDWADINLIKIEVTSGPALTVNATFDYMRIEKLDPHVASKPNPTYNEWDTQPTGSEWAITQDPLYDRYHIACLDMESSVEKIATNSRASSSDFFVISCQVNNLIQNGEVGMVFCCNDSTAGSEDTYALIIDTAADTLYLYEYTAGSRTSLGSASISVSLGSYYYLGVSKVADRMRCYFSSDYDTLYDEVLIEAEDSTLTRGYLGFISIGCSGRFTDFRVTEFDDTGLSIGNALMFMSGENVSEAIIFDNYGPPVFCHEDRLQLVHVFPCHDPLEHLQAMAFAVGVNYIKYVQPLHFLLAVAQGV